MQPTKSLVQVQTALNHPIQTVALGNLDLADSKAIESFGDTFAPVLSEVSKTLQTSEVKLKNMGEIGQTINSLLTAANSFNPDELLEEPGFLDKIFSSATKKLDKFIEKQKTVAEAIKSTADKLILNCSELVHENEQLQKAYDMHVAVVDQMTNLVAQGLTYKSQFESELLALKTEADKHENGFLQIQNYQQNAERFAQKLDSLIRSKAIVARQLVQIKIMQNTNITEVDTIRDIVSTSIPIWETNIGLGFSALKTKQVIENRNNVNLAINQTIQRNAALMQQNTEQAIEGSTSSGFSMETIKASQTSLINSINAIKSASELGKQKRADAFLQITAMDDELKQSLLN